MYTPLHPPRKSANGLNRNVPIRYPTPLRILIQPVRTVASFNRFIFFCQYETTKNSQLLSGSGSDDVLRDDLVLALDAVGVAQERRGEAEEAVRVLPTAEDLCGVAV